MLKIRLRRTGAKKQPRYRVVVAESTAPRDGAYVEILGWYNPQADPSQVEVNTEKTAQWLQRGAQPSDRVAYLLKQAGVGRLVEAAPAQAPAEEPNGKTPRRRRATAPKAADDLTAAETAPKATTPRRRTVRAAAVEPSASEAPEAEVPSATATPRKRATSKKSAADPPASESPESEGSAGRASD